MPASSTIVRNVFHHHDETEQTDERDDARGRSWNTRPAGVRRFGMYAVGESHQDQSVDQEERGEERNDDGDRLKDLKVDVCWVEQRLPNGEQRHGAERRTPSGGRDPEPASQSEVHQPAEHASDRT